MQLTNIARDVIEDKKRIENILILDFSSIKETINRAEIFIKSFNAIRAIPLNLDFLLLLLDVFIRKIGHILLRKKILKIIINAGKIYVPIYGKIIRNFFVSLDFLNYCLLKI